MIKTEYKPVTKATQYMIQCMKSPKSIDLWTQKTEEWLPRAGAGARRA